MKFIRFTQGSSIYSGVITEDIIRGIKGDIFGNWEYTGKTFSAVEVKWL